MPSAAPPFASVFPAMAPYSSNLSLVMLRSSLFYRARPFVMLVDKTASSHVNACLSKSHPCLPLFTAKLLSTSLLHAVRNLPLNRLALARVRQPLLPRQVVCDPRNRIVQKDVPFRVAQLSTDASLSRDMLSVLVLPGVVLVSLPAENLFVQGP